jgi:hypothetical protein
MKKTLNIYSPRYVTAMCLADSVSVGFHIKGFKLNLLNLLNGSDPIFQHKRTSSFTRTLKRTFKRLPNRQSSDGGVLPEVGACPPDPCLRIPRASSSLTCHSAQPENLNLNIFQRFTVLQGRKLQFLYFPKIQSFARPKNYNFT